jgi:nicotinic acid mononucleotide adenylyltransferase
MCDLILVTRPGYELSGSIPSEAVQIVDVQGMSQREISEVLGNNSGPRTFLTDVAMIDVSATAIRAAARADDHELLREMVPPAVAGYIEKYELYKN